MDTDTPRRFQDTPVGRAAARLEVSSSEPVWHKSSHSSFAHNCVEAAAVPSPQWRKSSHSSFKDGNCVEVAFAGGVSVMVRDTQNRQAAVVGVGSKEWTGLMCLLTRRQG